MINNAGYVWNLEDVRTLRQKFRILGSFIGFSPKTFQLGLPLQLQPVEVQLLREKGIIQLYQLDPELPPRQEVVARSQEQLEQSYQTQIEEFKAERIERIHAMADKIVEGKRKKLLQEGSRKRKLKELEDEDNLESKDKANKNEEDVTLDKDMIISQEIASIKPITRDMQVIQTMEQDPWIEAVDKQEVRWSYPATDPLARCRLFTFKDLWNNNYYVSEGSKFGGDFLVYCGDPVKYHAKYIVVCVSGRAEVESETRAQEVVARCRLGAGVKKVVLFSWLEGAEVRYKSLTRGADTSGDHG